MNDNYYYLEVKIPPHLEHEIDDTSRIMFSCQGIEEFSIEEAKVDEILGERSYSGGDVPVSVIDDVVEVMEEEQTAKKYYFSDESFVIEFKNYLLKNYQVRGIIHSEEIKDWNTEWRKSYESISINDSFFIIPEWEKGSHRNFENKLFIYPGQGFGTGSHETTFLCIKIFLENISKKNPIKTCLDFGCGSGILGLTLLKHFKNAQLDLYDIDVNAIENSRQNIDLNEMAEQKIRLLLPENKADIDMKYDLVFANILQNILLEESSFLANSLLSGGKMILSGLLAGQEVEVIETYRVINPKLIHIETQKKGDWVAVLLAEQ